MTVRIAHISDTHLGTRPRRGVKHNIWAVEMRIRLLENDFYERFAELFDRISELDPPADIVIHSGDLYDSPWEYNPTQPPVVAQEIAFSVLKEFIEKTEIPVLIIEGNHGLYRSLEVSLLNSLGMSVPGLKVATQVDLKHAFSKGEPLVHSFNEVDVFCFPYIEQSVLESSGLLEDFNDWITTHQVPTSGRISVAVAHGMELDRTLYPGIFSLDYDYIALGHDHHQHKHASNSWYAGSPERWRFDETRHEKGFLVIDIEAGKTPIITPHHFEFKRPVYNERIHIDLDDNADSVIEKVETWLEVKGLKKSWDPETAARVRLIFEGGSPRVSLLELSTALEAFRMKAFDEVSKYNLIQLVWQVRQQETDYESFAYPEIESEYLIEDPEEDFKNYLETVKIDERYDSQMLTQIAVQALKSAVGGCDEELTIDTISEDER